MFHAGEPNCSCNIEHEGLCPPMRATRDFEDPKTVVGCTYAECNWTASYSATLGGASRAIEARREHIAEAHPGPPPAAVSPTPTLGQFLAAVRRDDAELHLDMPDPVQMWGVFNPHAGEQERDKPLALFPEEHAAWRWLLSPGGMNGGPRGRFAIAPDALRVRPFIVSAAVVV